jgi:hypothetical protein
MMDMYKTFLIGALATVLLAAVVGLSLIALDASNEVKLVVSMIGAGAAGLIGGEVARRTEPSRLSTQGRVARWVTRTASRR